MRDGRRPGICGLTLPLPRKLLRYRAHAASHADPPDIEQVLAEARLRAAERGEDFDELTRRAGEVLDTWCSHEGPIPFPDAMPEDET